MIFVVVYLSFSQISFVLLYYHTHWHSIMYGYVLLDSNDDHNLEPLFVMIFFFFLLFIMLGI